MHLTPHLNTLQGSKRGLPLAPRTPVLEHVYRLGAALEPGAPHHVFFADPGYGAFVAAFLEGAKAAGAEMTITLAGVCEPTAVACAAKLFPDAAVLRADTPVPRHADTVVIDSAIHGRDALALCHGFAKELAGTIVLHDARTARVMGLKAYASAAEGAAALMRNGDYGCSFLAVREIDHYHKRGLLTAVCRKRPVAAPATPPPEVLPVLEKVPPPFEAVVSAAVPPPFVENEWQPGDVGPAGIPGLTGRRGDAGPPGEPELPEGTPLAGGPPVTEPELPDLEPEVPAKKVRKPRKPKAE